MSKKAISVTLDVENVTWLKGRAGGARLRGVSELLNRIVSAARASGAGPARSVVGTIDIDASDPWLEKADAAVRAMFETSLRRPMAVRETPPGSGGRRRARRKRGG